MPNGNVRCNQRLVKRNIMSRHDTNILERNDKKEVPPCAYQMYGITLAGIRFIYSVYSFPMTSSSRAALSYVSH